MSTVSAEPTSPRNARERRLSFAKMVVPPVIERTVVLDNFKLEHGVPVPQVPAHFQLEGVLNQARDNLTVVVHALTGDARASHWWRGVVGPGCAIDTNSQAVLCVTLPDAYTLAHVNSIPVPRIGTRDFARIVARLLDELQVDTPRLICGGSLGGMVTLEFAAGFPDRVRGAVVLAAPAAQTAHGAAWNAIMRRALDVAGDRDGLALARMVGMLSYRTPDGLERRFGRTTLRSGRYKVDEWLSAHGEKLVQRFSGNRYRALIDAMDLHDVGRERGGIAAALAPVRHKLHGAGIAGDLLYPAESVREWTLLSGASYHEITSQHGHDAFLLEAGRVSAIIKRALSESSIPDNRRAVSLPAHTQGKVLRIALAGCGHVGGALVQLLSGENPLPDATPQVVRTLALDGERVRPALASAFERGIATDIRCSTDADQLLDGDIDVLVEAIGGTDTASRLIERALRRGIRVVTANKALIAARGPELMALAWANRTRIDFDAAVAGAVPVVRSIRARSVGAGITRVQGILNGTCNYVLDRLSSGATLHEAIAEAQTLGYAEADPWRDLSGQDSEDKIRILAWLTFGIAPNALHVVRHGIDEATASWAVRVAAEGDRLKLIATIERTGDGIVGRIAPVRVPRDSPWARVAGATNRVAIESESVGLLVFEGAGAGGMATASAMLADLASD